MTDFRLWAMGTGGVVEGAAAVLYAITPDGPVRLSGGVGPSTLVEVPVDRLALGPVALGGMVTIAGSTGPRIVCADLDGGVGVFECLSGAPILTAPSTDDLDVVALLWRLMDPAATSVDPPELLARLALWAWLDHPDRRVADGEVDPGVRAFVTGDLVGLLGLVGVDVAHGDDIDSYRMAEIADVVGHPPLTWDVVTGCDDESGRLRFLQACLPTRWQLAEELRAVDRRQDLADAVMAAATFTSEAPAR